MLKKIGFVVGWAVFFIMLLLPSTKSMYVEGFKVVLKHSDKTITSQFPASITRENFDRMYPGYFNAFAPYMHYLGIAYAASIGGIGTLIGTPPNLVFAAFADTLLGKKITFTGWLAIGLPVVIIILPIAWWMLIKYFKVKGKSLTSSKEIIEKKISELGKMGKGERNTLIIFLLVALMWITRTFWTKPLHLYWVNDSVIAIFGVILFYIVPVNLKKWEFTLDWETNKNIPWGTLLLFVEGWH